MGNRIFRARRYVVEERYTRPQRLPANVDYKKLRKLILSQKLAPCFDGVDDSSSNGDLEECPICFFFYPSLNRSRCCSKGICTECFLQMNPSSAMRPAQCPFCKSPNYAVEYRGAKTEEEKGLEQAEEQKVIEAKLRMQFQESQTTDQATLPNQQLCPVEVQYPTEGSIHHSNAGWTQEVGNSNLSLHGRGIEASQFPFPNALSQRHAEFGLNLDEAMLMEAIWRSIQNNCLQNHSQPFSESYRTGVSQMETYGLNQGFSYLPMIGHVESSNSVSIEVARMPERSILQPGAFQLTNNNEQTSQIQGAHFVQHQHQHQHQHHMPDTLSHGRNMIQMGLQYSANTEFCDATADDECLASCSSTEDDSWDSLSAGVLQERSHGSQDEFHSDGELVKEEEFDDTSSCSSVHTISDISYGSPNCLEMFGSQNFCSLSGPIVGSRHQQTFTGYHS